MQKHFRLYIYIFGNVQGVGFRKFTKKKADELSIRGHVENLDSGEVKVIAEAEKEILDSFVSILEKGNDRSSVEYMNLKWKNISSFSFEDFKVV